MSQCRPEHSARGRFGHSAWRPSRCTWGSRAMRLWGNFPISPSGDTVRRRRFFKKKSKRETLQNDLEMCSTLVHRNFDLHIAPHIQFTASLYTPHLHLLRAKGRSPAAALQHRTEGHFLSREGSGNTRQRQCLSTGGSGSTRQGQCLGHEGSGNTRQRHCRLTSCPEGSGNTRQRQCLHHEGSGNKRQRRLFYRLRAPARFRRARSARTALSKPQTCAKTGGVLHVTCSAPPGLHSCRLIGTRLQLTKQTSRSSSR